MDPVGPAPTVSISKMLQIDLTNKVAVVTGGSGELGRVMARTLADCGAAVAVHYLRGRVPGHR